MKTTYIQTKLRTIQRLVALLVAATLSSAFGAPDTLYVGDEASNTIKRFNADTGQSPGGGASNGVYVATSSGGLFGPRGLIISSGKLIVVNQNSGQPFPGEVLRYKLSNGVPERKLVPSDDAHAPWSPRGMVSLRGVIYVADFIISDTVTDTGKLLAFDEKKGTFLAEFSPPAGFVHLFHPRGLVIGSNGLLYVTNTPTFPPSAGGQVMVFDPTTFDFIGDFITDAGGVGQLNRPEGLVFGPDGDLYVLSFRANATDTDSIRIYDGATGVFKRKIDLDVPGNENRAFAQALLFGPGGKLFVPITGGVFAGQVRRYNVADGAFDVFAQLNALPGLGPWYLTFGKTDPGTLAYDVHCKEDER